MQHMSIDKDETEAVILLDDLEDSAIKVDPMDDIKTQVIRKLFRIHPKTVVKTYNELISKFR